MAVHKIITDPDGTPVELEFQLWRGDRPPVVQGNIANFTRAGADGIAQQQLGEWHQPIVARLESWFATYAAAIAELSIYMPIVTAGKIVDVVYENTNWNAEFNTRFIVNAVHWHEPGDGAQSVVQLLSNDGTNFIGGTRLRTTWTLTPHDLTP